MEITREEVLKSPEIHYFAKNVLKMTENKDTVDCLHDLELVKQVIKGELNNDEIKF